MKRIDSIDIMRGLTLILMIFVNDLYVPGVPEWMVHTKANFDGMGLADWVFPGFLFMVGMSIPFAVDARRNKGQKNKEVFFHILIRSVSLLIIGVMMVNISSYNNELTDLNNFAWALLLYLSFFLIWNKYSDRRMLFRVLQYTGIVLLILLAISFRGGTVEDPSWLKTSWWGILGLIGWGYFIIASAYLLIGKRLLLSLLVFLVFLSLNILAQLELLVFPKIIMLVFGVILNGNVPLIVSGGLFAGIFLIKYKHKKNSILIYFLSFAIISFFLGFLLRKWFIISKILGTPSWALICTGISFLVFVMLFYLVDIKNYKKPFVAFFPPGKNSLTTYLIPDVLYYSIWSTAYPIFFYKQDYSELLAVSGSIVWSMAMIGLAILLSRANIRLKL